MFKFEDSFFNEYIVMIIRIIYELLYKKALFLYIYLLHFSQTMVKNHKMFGNTSIIIMVSKVILLLRYAQQIVKGCYNFRESSTTLGHNKPWTCY